MIHSENYIKLDAKSSMEFAKMLSAPPVPNARLQKLIFDISILEQEEKTKKDDRLDRP